MNRTQKFFYNTVSTAGLQIIILISGFIVPRFMLTYYGSEVNGLISSINQFINYLKLVEAGLASAAIYALYKPLAGNKKDEIDGILSASRLFYNQTGFIFLGLMAVLSGLYPLFVKSEILTPLYVGLLVVALGLDGILEFFTMSRYRVLLSADQKIYVISISTAISIILNTIIVVVLARYRINIVIVKFVALISILSRSAILNIYARMKYKNLNYKATPNKQALNKRWDALFLQILSVMHTGVPILIATFILSLKLVSVYSVYNIVIAGIGGILSIFISGLSSSFGNVIVQNEQNTLKKTYSQFEFIYYKILIFVYSCTLILIVPFISIYTQNISDINYYLPLFGILLTLNSLFYNLKTPQGMLIISAGMFKETRWQTTTQGLLAIVGCIVFGLFFGLEGIAIGMIISNVYRCIDLYIFVPKRITHTKISSTLRQVLILGCTIILIYLPFFFIKIETNSYSQWLIWAIIVAAYAMTVTVITSLILDYKLTKEVMKRILSIFRKSSKKKEVDNG